MGNRLSADIGFAALGDIDCRHNAGEEAFLLQGVLNGHPIHDRPEHSHVIGLSLLDADLVGHPAAPNVPRSDDDPDLHAGVVDLLHDASDVLKLFAIENRTVFAIGEGFAGQLDDNAFVNRVHAVGIITERKKEKSRADEKSALVA